MEERSRILYVEDDFNNRILVSRVLQAAGYEMLEAEDGITGIRMAQETKPDLILMDINMPGLDGYAAATKIKSLPGLNRTPVIALTANVMVGDRERALTAGCDGYLPKPIDVDALPEQIREFLGGRRETVDEEEERGYLREYNERLVASLEEKIDALTKANEQLQRSDVMKSRFIAVAAHELRTPLTVIRGYVDMLLSMSRSSAKVEPSMLEGISTGVKRLHEIVQNMLDVTHIEAGTLQLQVVPLSIATIIEPVVDSYRDVLQQRKLSLMLEPLRELPSIWGDNVRLQQVFKNLIGNAIKFTPDGGSITVKGEKLESEARNRLPHRLEGDAFIEVTISDTGVGIDAAELEHIFERFYEVRDPSLHGSTSKTDFMGGGAGLGLSIARGVADAHGGWIWADSNGYDVDRCPGSRFYVVLPVGAPPKR